jgi:NAD(P)-dependent dehydrogenase (short-subunit alcohol dehydrogenase family)
MGVLNERVAVITGAASGIGRGIATRFAAEGAKVVVADIDEDGGRLVAAQADGTFVPCDVTVEADLEAAVAAAIDGYGRLDCWVGNAGIGGVSGPITELDAAGFDQTVAVLLRSVALGMKHACRAMQAGNRGGSIISTSSVAGLQGGCGPHVYSACKAGVIGLTRTVALEQGPFGIRVNCINPGGVETAIFNRNATEFGLDPAEVLRLVKASTSAQTALGRIGQPEDIAGAALWLASPDSAYVTGQAIVVDGGLTSSKPLFANVAEALEAVQP